MNTVRSTSARPAAALVRAGHILGLAALACKGEGDAQAGRTAGSAAGDAVPPSVITPSARPYREVALANPGAVRVVVKLDGDPPPDTTFQPAPDQQAACGTAVPGDEVVHRVDRLAGAVVWLPDVREGKPLPVERRYELTIERCRFAPHVQVAVGGSTLNLRALDDVAHRTRFVRHGDGARLAEIATTEPLSVVPDEKVLRAPGQVEVSCAVHPWARAWLMTFDHPYAAVSGPDGSTRLDGVPPGRWRVVVWHDRFGVREDSVTVEAGKEAEIEVKLKAR